MQLSLKNIEDYFPEFGIRVLTDNMKNENIIENKIKVVHLTMLLKIITY